MTDADGKEYPVSRILGADELYDVIKFKVEVPKKAVFLPIAREPISQGVIAYLMPARPVRSRSSGKDRSRRSVS